MGQESMGGLLGTLISAAAHSPAQLAASDSGIRYIDHSARFFGITSRLATIHSLAKVSKRTYSCTRIPRISLLAFTVCDVCAIELL
jgi:hypothetical protein